MIKKVYVVLETTAQGAVYLDGVYSDEKEVALYCERLNKVGTFTYKYYERNIL